MYKTKSKVIQVSLMWWNCPWCKENSPLFSLGRLPFLQYVLGKTLGVVPMQLIFQQKWQPKIKLNPAKPSLVLLKLSMTNIKLFLLIVLSGKKNYAWASFLKTIKIAQVQRISAIGGSKKTWVCFA